MARLLRPSLGFVALAMILGGTSGLLWSRATATPPAPLFDLGSVLLVDGTGAADGAVEFDGGQGRGRSVRKLVASCACLSARLPSPDARRTQKIVVPVNLQLASSGEKRAFLTALFDDGTHEIVHVRANGIIAGWSTSPKLTPAVLTLTTSETACVTALVHGAPTRAPLISWRFPPGVAVDSLTRRFLPPMREQDLGVWEIITTVRRNRSDERTLIGIAVMEVDGAQAAALTVVGERTAAGASTFRSFAPFTSIVAQSRAPFHLFSRDRSVRSGN